MLKNNIQLSKFEALIGFIKQFMNQAESYLATRRVLCRIVWNERFLQEEGWGKKTIIERKGRIILALGHLFRRNKLGRKVPTTSDCENKWRLWLSEREGCRCHRCSSYRACTWMDLLGDRLWAPGMASPRSGSDPGSWLRNMTLDLECYISVVGHLSLTYVSMI